jgi:hypothetical protein
MAKTDFSLSASQKSLIHSKLDERVFLHGPAGSGKSTVGVQRLLHLINSGVDAGSILVMTPQRTLAAPYKKLLQSHELPAGTQTSIYTFSGLAQRMVELFWPLVAGQAGFANPAKPPVFLTLETAQYYMARVAKPFLDKGYFEGIALDHNRLFSQILDNLNKSASAGFPMEETSERLKAAWLPSGEASRLMIYDQAQETALAFRRFCLEHNLLDFSLQVDVFIKHVWPSVLGKTFLKKKYQHLIVDNLEEDIPVAHDVLKEWLPDFQSALLIMDDEAGFRSFLGADPRSAANLASLCSKTESLSTSFVSPQNMDGLRQVMINQITGNKSEEDKQSIESAYMISTQPFTPQMTEWVAAQTANLIQTQGILAGEIVIVAPFMSDALRFSLRNALGKFGVPSWSNRPSRSLSEEPATRCLLTLAQIAHPQWEMAPSMFDIRYALLQVLTNGDMIRADLIAQMLYKQNKLADGLSAFERLQGEAQERLTYQLGERYTSLRNWLETYKLSPPVELDIFFSRLFGEVLSQPGFGFHLDFEAAAVVSKLIESAQKFRLVSNLAEDTSIPVGKEYIQMTSEGVIAAQYISAWEDAPEDAVLIAPAHTYLMANRPVAVQFWLDIGSEGWWRRLYQPLTHPFVLSRAWENTVWTDVQEELSDRSSLARIVNGLLRRCGQQVIFCYTSIDERGNEERGHLLRTIQSVQKLIAQWSGKA